MNTEEHLPPNYEKLAVALRSLGYSFETAVADVVDNSIDADATTVLVRLIMKRDRHLDLAVFDNGHGMSDETLREAMRFGADVSSDIARLGKFGMGLKLASMSQAKEVSVMTLRNNRMSGRAWLEHGVASGFSSTIFDTDECSRRIADVLGDRILKASGTLVLWSRLYRVHQHQYRPEEQAQKLMHRLQNHLALAFHRFLSGHGRKVSIAIDIFDQGAKRAGIPIKLEALDPFYYDQSGHKDFPAQMFLEESVSEGFAMKAHVWPPNSTAPGYRLPGGANARQGFYFYRNNRLIQAGGWNGIREAEPHLSLARIEIDISPDVDLHVGLDVKKVQIQLPPALVSSIEKARTSSGVDFRKYLSLAEDAYRKRKPTQSELPLIPSSGLPSALAAFLHKELRIKETAKHRDLKIKWKKMPKQSFFEIDRDGGYLHLNRAYRRVLLHGLPGSSADLPVLKCLLFLALKDELSSERMGSRIREKINQLNRILVRAVKYERAAE